MTQPIGVFFDESLFEDGFTLRDCPVAATFNRADEYLATRRHGKVATTECGRASAETRVVNLNPIVPCRGFNVYTMDAEAKETLRSASYRQIVVLDAFDVDELRALRIGEPDVDACVYDVGGNDLTALESAIMLKYYAVRSATATTANEVRVTRVLYLLVRDKFADTRSWFRFGDRDGDSDDDDDDPIEVVDVSGDAIDAWSSSF